MTEGFPKISYPDNFIPLGEFGLKAEKLNESVLVGAEVTYARPPLLDDVLHFGAETICAGYAEAEKGWQVLSADEEGVSAQIAHPPLVILKTKALRFEEHGLKLYVVSEAPIKNERGQEIGTRLFELPAASYVIFTD